MRFSKHALLSTIALFATACATQQTSAPTISPATTPAEADLVDIRSLVPDIDLDIRYAGANNFTGAPVDGYEAPKMLPAAPRRRSARARRAASCATTTCACASTIATAPCAPCSTSSPGRTRRKTGARRPRTTRRSTNAALLGDYISPTSGHSRGATVDLDLMECDDTGVPCTPLDMGTPFDFFDTLRTPIRRRPPTRSARTAIACAMRWKRAGFRNYPMEWWHFTLEARAVTARLRSTFRVRSVEDSSAAIFFAIA